jgi:hypothetical protein
LLAVIILLFAVCIISYFLAEGLDNNVLRGAAAVTFILGCLSIPLCIIVFKIEAAREKRSFERYLEENGYEPTSMKSSILSMMRRTDFYHSSLVKKIEMGHTAIINDRALSLCRATMGAKSSDMIFTYYVCIMNLDLRKGTMFARHENRDDRLKKMVGKDDLNFENKEFSDRWYVKAKPDRFAYEFFHPRMIQLFLKYWELSAIVHNGTIMVYLELPERTIHKKDHRNDIHSFPRNFENISKIMLEVEKLLPDYLLETKRGDHNK